MKKLVIIPTYNECENIEALVRDIFAKNQDLNVLVVDDNSPDGTAKIVEALIAGEFSNQLHILNRPGKQGLGRAYIAGFQWALENSFDAVIEMDADFSHRVEDLVKISEAIEASDAVVGSRYIPGGSVANWTWYRKLISLGGSLYSTLILWRRVKDWTGGFNAYRKEVLQDIGLDQINSEGYSFQIELKYRTLKKGFKLVEVPIRFEDRRGGQSKMGMKIFVEALYRVWKIRFT
ncbi:MAG: polyprenol monophosphomannose synthase [Bdellovibrionota bacterium]|nr:dolichyl-phosphate beta-D-mannosyltransferase [Pseudobdellovibrionaceae bacterium]|tara:strand:- start:80928 stop:81629 length:702 start_codon:yes stop_codon:yes gene_type:complete